MQKIAIKNNGTLYGHCYVNKRNVVKSLYVRKHALYKDHFADNMRINARMLKKKAKFSFDEPVSKYKASNLMDNEKFLNKGRMLIIE